MASKRQAPARRCETRANRDEGSGSCTGLTGKGLDVARDVGELELALVDVVLDNLRGPLALVVLARLVGGREDGVCAAVQLLGNTCVLL